MHRRVILIIIILFSTLLSCNLSYKSVNSAGYPSCSNYYEIAKASDMVFIKNKEFRTISRFLKKKFEATIICQIVYFKSKNIYFCEFYTTKDTIHCLLLDDNMELVSEEKIQYDY